MKALNFHIVSLNLNLAVTQVSCWGGRNGIWSKLLSCIDRSLSLSPSKCLFVYLSVSLSFPILTAIFLGDSELSSFTEAKDDGNGVEKSHSTPGM